MAGRPLSARPHPNRDGSVTVRMPDARGSTRRPNVNFPTTESAERWRAAALAARKAGRPLPDPEPYRAAANRRAPEVLLGGFADVAWAWWEKFYPSNGRHPQRRDDIESHIRNHLVPFFSPRVDHVRDITYEDCEEFVDYLSGKRSTATPAQTIVTEARELTLADAAKWCGRSKSGIQKARSSGKFPNAYLDTSASDMGVVRIPVGDLIAAGYVPQEGTAEVPYGLSEKHVNSLLNDLRQIFKFAIGKRLITVDISTGLKAKEPALTARVFPKGSRADAPVYLFDLATCKRIASRLHIHHQMVFWLLRCAGLRIGEAYGIRLEDIYHRDGYMTIRVWRQGGKYFKVADEEGHVQRVTSKESLKTKSSQRVLPIARPLATLIDIYVDAFHSDETDPATPLVATIRGCGQSGFRDALHKATIAEGCGVEDAGFVTTPKTLRTFFATELDDIALRPRSSYMGHKMLNLDGSAAITESTYTVQHKGVQRLLVVSDTMAARIESSIGSLVEPVASSRLLPASLCVDTDEREGSLEVLDAAGCVAAAVVDGHEVVEVSDAAQMLKVSEKQVGALVRKGLLVRQRVDGPGRSSFFGVDASSVHEQMALVHGAWTRQRLCVEFDLTYRQVDYLIGVLGVTSLESDLVRGYLYAEEQVEKLRRYMDERAEVSRHAVSMKEAAKALGCTRRTAAHFITAGHLVVDDESSTAMGWTMVTRASLEQLLTQRAPRRALPSVQPTGTIPIREAQERTGLSRVEVLKLAASGVVIHRTSDYRFWVDEASLESHFHRESKMLR